MREVLERINKRYLRNANNYCNDFDHAVYMFLNVAFAQVASRDENAICSTLDNVQKELAKAVETAIIAYESYECLCDNKDDENKETVEALRESAADKYKYAREIVGFRADKNEHFRAAAEIVIGMGVTHNNFYINQGSAGCALDVYKAYRAICKAF